MLPLYTRRRCTRSRTSRFIRSTRPENRIKIRVLSREKIFDKFASYSNATLTRTTWKNLLLRRRAQGYANGKNVKSWDGTASRRRKSERNRAKLSPIRFYFELTPRLSRRLFRTQLRLAARKENVARVSNDRDRYGIWLAISSLIQQRETKGAMCFDPRPFSAHGIPFIIDHVASGLCRWRRAMLYSVWQ